ncbi:MAG TPA: hypothetical protein VEZ90_14240 [Blastocatellia bacterium]|nr:hypothetical protein [Blastocatellia bacterium]
MPQEMFKPLILEEVTDPLEVSSARARREKFDRNFAWFRAHASEVYERHRGEFICIAGEDVFAAATPEEAVARATTAYPEDEGRFVQYIPREKMARVYADQR